MTKKSAYVLPADQYDALELAAEAHGGVGASRMFRHDDLDQPYCAYGLAWWAGIIRSPKLTTESPATSLFLASNRRKLPFTWVESDVAVHSSVNPALRHVYGTDRIPFHVWARALGLTRGA